MGEHEGAGIKKDRSRFAASFEQMTGEKAIYYILSNDAGVSGKVGTRIFNTFAPQSATLPYVVFTIAPGGVLPFDTKTTTQGAADLDRITFEVHSYATSQKEASQIDETVRSVLDRYPAGVVDGVKVDGVQYSYTTNYPEPEFSDGGGGIVYHYVSEYHLRIKY